VPDVPETSRIQLAVYALALCAIVWLGARYLGREPVGSGAPAAGAQGTRSGDAIQVRGADTGPVTIHVAGAVRHPGVYRLRAGSRVQEAVRSAGGATSRADLDGLNLAGKVEDGRQIVVPRRAPGGSAATVAPASAAGSPSVPAAPVDLNQATLEVLDTLDGVGPATARKILAYREEHGGFGSVEELGEVSGIGEKRLAALRERVRV